MTNDIRQWRKSTRSGGSQGACVEVGAGTGGTVIGVRDTKDRVGGTLVFDRAEWSAFLASL